MLHAIDAARYNDETTVIHNLLIHRDTLAHLGTTLDRMYERCDAGVFYNQLRPFLAGTKSMEQFGLPDGIRFNNGRETLPLRSYRGGSNAQSSLIQFFDIVLGIEHTGSAGVFLHEMRDYMPGPHRAFLEDVAKVANIRQFAEARRQSNPAVYAAYARCLEMLGALRGRHLQVVARYVISQSRKVDCAQRATQRPVGHWKQEKNKASLVGTGGTDLIPFLKRTLQKTIEPITNIIWERGSI